MSDFSGDWRPKASRRSLKGGGRKAPLGAQFEAYATAINPVNETLDLMHHGGPAAGRGIPFSYVGQRSWARSMPDSAAAVHATQLFNGTGGGAVVPTRFVPLTGGKVEGYKNKKNVYRTLEPGEHEFSSPGLAQLFLSRRGNAEIRGGVSWLHVKNDAMEIHGRTVLHRRSLHRQTNLLPMNWEERFGAVKRQGLVSPAAERFVVAPGTDLVAMEYYRALGTNRPNIMGVLDIVGGSIPGAGALTVHHEGDLTDLIKGLTPILGGPINAPLRAQHKWRTEAGGQVKIEIDILGNISCVLPETALPGFVLKMTNPLSMLKIDTSGIIATSGLHFDGVSWPFHRHLTAFGPTSGVLPV